MCKAIDVANYFMSLTEDEAGDSITNLKMQKLVYYAQGFALAIFNAPLFSEDIEAWTYGPVVPELYHEFKQYGGNPIPRPDHFDCSMFSEEEKNLLDNVYSEYGQFSAWRLRDMTHNEPPWKNTQVGSVITHDEMKKYFSTLVE